MDLATFADLLTPAGQTALADAAALSPSEKTFLACFNRLHKRHPAELARAALETVLLRQKARAKFHRADAMYFTREALEQASGEVVARYRAERFAGYAIVGDFCCGIGGDAIGLAAVSRVIAVDIDPLRLAMAEQNLAAYRLGERGRFITGDVQQMPLPEVQAIFFDPSRRPGGRRRLSVRDYEPPLEIVKSWQPRVPAVGVKLAPGIDEQELAGYGGETEFLSVDGELKECTLWLGPLRTTARRATLLPGRHTLAADAPAAAPPLSPPLACLYEPDPAVIRAGLVTNLAEQIGARQIDPDIAYLTADGLVPTPFATAYRLDEALPFHLGRLRECLRAMHVGRLIVKRRGSAVDPEELVRRLKLSGAEQRVLFLTRVAGRPFSLVGRPAGARPDCDTDRGRRQ